MESAVGCSCGTCTTVLEIDTWCIPDCQRMSTHFLFSSCAQRARVDGHEVDVPLLQIFWTSTSPTASTVISLDSAVVIPENNLDPSKANCNPFRFKIRHVKKSISDPESSFQLTRVFSCPKESRDDWVYAINHALLEYEKEKANARRLSGMLSLSPPRGRSSLSPWMTENAVSPDALRQHRKQLQHPLATVPFPSS